MEDLERVFNSIVDESENFLKNHMLFEIIEMQITKDNNLYDYICVVDFDGFKKIRVIISFEDRLFKSVFDSFFKSGVDASELDELVDGLSDEVLNIIVGLAMKNFPKKHEELILGEPFKLEKEKILEILSLNMYKNVKIITNKGNFSCSVVLEDV